MPPRANRATPVRVRRGRQAVAASVVQPAMNGAPPAPGAAPAPPARDWRDLKLRIASAVLLVPLGLFSIWDGGVVWFVALMIVFGGMAIEWAALCDARPPAPVGLVAVASVLACGVALRWAGPVPAAFLLAAGGALVLSIGRPVWLGVGTLYLGAALLCLMILRATPGGLLTTLFLTFAVWSSDIGAYLAGRLLGGPKLAPSISPGKTWTGAAGGLACASGIGMAFAVASGHRGGAIVAAGLAAAGLSVVSQAGDLLESAAKRRFGRKDSSRLIPGHGGLLDRLDGWLAAAPAALALASTGWW